MDDKVSPRNKPGVRRRRYQRMLKYGRKSCTLLRTHKNTFLTWVLFTLLALLFVGIVGQLRSPAINTAPDGVTVLDYSTFVEQVKGGNVLAVALQGNDLNGLLASPLSPRHLLPQQRATPIAQNPSASSDYVAWTRTLGIGNSSWASTSTIPQSSTQITADRAVFMHIPAGGNAYLLTLLERNNVVILTLPASQSSVWLVLVWHFIPIILIIVLLFVFMATRNHPHSARTIDDRVSQMGRSRVRRFERAQEGQAKETNVLPAQKKPASVSPASLPARTTSARVSAPPQVTFADVAGIDEVRAELIEIVQFLRDPERFQRLGARIPRGALLVGPPGTGKTLLARAVAGEAAVPFFSMSASEFVEMFVGVGASRVRELFNQARQAAPCVVFLDEIDAVGRKRSMRVNGSDERDQTLNQLLVELDGFDERQAVVVLAATNRVDILDKALLRPGRFDRHITVSPPDRFGREAILKVHTRTTPLHDDVSLEHLSRLTTGMTGADLANLVNEAALAAARRDQECVNHECFEEALARVQLGALRPLIMSEQERRIIAIHEGGHALVAYHLPEADSVNRVTILPRGQSLGVTQFTAEVDRYNYSRETLMARIAVGLGGRVAEELTFGRERVTTGAENDLQVVTGIARRMVTRWGMSEGVGVVFADAQAENDYALSLRRIDPDAVPARSLVLDADGHLRLNGMPSERQHAFAATTPSARSMNGVMLNTLIDAEVQRILNEGYELARTQLTDHYDQLLLLADALVEHEQLDRAQFEALLQE